MTTDLGLDPRNVTTIGVNPQVRTIDRAGFDAARVKTDIAVGQVLDRIRSMPGVQAVAAMSGGTPLSGNWRTNWITVPDAPEFKLRAS